MSDSASTDLLGGICRSVVEDSDVCWPCPQPHGKQHRLIAEMSDSASADLRGGLWCCRSVVEDPDIGLEWPRIQLGLMSMFDSPAQSTPASHNAGPLMASLRAPGLAALHNQIQQL